MKAFQAYASGGKATVRATPREAAMAFLKKTQVSVSARCWKGPWIAISLLFATGELAIGRGAEASKGHQVQGPLSNRQGVENCHRHFCNSPSYR